MITKEQLVKIINPTRIEDTKLISIVDTLNQTFEKYQINTSLRQSHFLGQVLHESCVFQYSREIWGNTEAQKNYEGRKDLGNIQSGDGFKFRGAGWLQTTGRYNFFMASKEFGVDFITNPNLLGTFPYCGLVSGWFWFKHNLNNIADDDNVSLVTVRINGGYTGLKQRENWVNKCKDILITK